MGPVSGGPARLTFFTPLLPRNYELPWKKEREEGRREELSKNIPPCPLPRSWKFTRHNDNYLPCFVTPRFPSLLGARLTKEERFLASWLPPPPPPLPPSFHFFLSGANNRSKFGGGTRGVRGSFLRGRHVLDALLKRDNVGVVSPCEIQRFVLTRFDFRFQRNSSSPMLYFRARIHSYLGYFSKMR